MTKRNVAVVHFSHHAIMNHKVPFPDDLNHALQTWDSETRSCCAVWPYHTMNLPGSVGLLYKPSLSNVISVLPDDSGSSDHGGNERSFGVTPSLTSLPASLAVPPNSYNEWRILGAEPVGIFVLDANNIGVKQRQPIPIPEELEDTMCDHELGCSSVDIEFIYSQFPQFDVYTLGSTGLEIIGSGGGV